MTINKTVLQKNGFASCSISGWRLWHRDIPDDGFLNLCCNDLKAQNDDFERVSCGADSEVYRFTYAERTFYFKEFLNRGGKEIIKNLFRGTRSMRALAGELVLHESGLNSPPILVVGARGARNFMVTEAIPDVRSVYLLEDEPPETYPLPPHQLLTRLGRDVGTLHAHGISHGDLRWGNILISGSGKEMKTYFIDNERTVQITPIPDSLRLKNLVQMSMSASSLSTYLILRFYAAYLKENPELYAQRREWFERVRRKTDERQSRVTERMKKGACLIDGSILREAPDDAPSLSESQELWSTTADRRKQWITALTEFIDKTIALDVYHPNLSTETLGFREMNGSPRFFYINYNGMHGTDSLSRSQIIEMLLFLLPYLHDCPRQLRTMLLRASAERLNESPHKLYTSLCQAMAVHGESLRRQRQHAYLNQSQFVTKTETNAGTWRLCHGFKRSVAETAVARHTALVMNDVPRLVKNDKKRRLSRIEVDGVSYIVKEYIKPGPWGRFSADHLSWTAATGLETYGIRACRYHAWLKASSGQSYIIIEDLGIKNLHHQLINAKNSAKRRRLLGLAGKLLGYLHSLKIYHRDMKDDNFIIDDQQAFAKILDLDAVRFASSDIDRARVRNFRQFCGTLPPEVSHYERYFAFAAYRHETGLSKGQLRTLINDVNAALAARH